MGFDFRIADTNKEMFADLTEGVRTAKSGQYFSVKKITGLTDFQIKELWALDTPENFFARHKETFKRLSKTQFRHYTVVYDIDDDYSDFKQADNQEGININIEAIGNQLYRVDSTKNKLIANFNIRIIAQVENDIDSKRIAEMVNFKNIKQVVEITPEIFTSVREFKKMCIRLRGNFQFRGNEQDLEDLMLLLFEYESNAIEIYQWGWQSDLKIWAWANGIVNKDGFSPVDKHGFSQLQDENIYLAPFSSFISRTIFADY